MAHAMGPAAQSAGELRLPGPSPCARRSSSRRWAIRLVGGQNPYNYVAQPGDGVAPERRIACGTSSPSCGAIGQFRMPQLRKPNFLKPCNRWILRARGQALVSFSNGPVRHGCGMGPVPDEPKVFPMIRSLPPSTACATSEPQPSNWTDWVLDDGDD